MELITDKVNAKNIVIYYNWQGTYHITLKRKAYTYLGGGGGSIVTVISQKCFSDIKSILHL